MLHLHGIRLSGDQDMFHSSQQVLRQSASSDVAALRQAGFEVDAGRATEGINEAVVAREGEGTTRLQWVEAGTWNFYGPVPDADFGWRLHMADVCINKVLVAVNRRQVRDYVDLYFIHRHVMPLWVAMWAAPGKDETWSPIKIAARIERQNGFRQAEMDQEVMSMVSLDAREVAATIRGALDEAREVFATLPDETAGMLMVNGSGEPLTDPEAFARGAGRLLEASEGGTWSSDAETDAAMVGRLIDEFGPHGSRICDAGENHGGEDASVPLPSPGR